MPAAFVDEFRTVHLTVVTRRGEPPLTRRRTWSCRRLERRLRKARREMERELGIRAIGGADGEPRATRTSPRPRAPAAPQGRPDAVSRDGRLLNVDEGRVGVVHAHVARVVEGEPRARPNRPRRDRRVGRVPRAGPGDRVRVRLRSSAPPASPPASRRRVRRDGERAEGRGADEHGLEVDRRRRRRHRPARRRAGEVADERKSGRRRRGDRSRPRTCC
jgi:hypothetical protein